MPYLVQSEYHNIQGLPRRVGPVILKQPVQNADGSLLPTLVEAINACIAEEDGAITPQITQEWKKKLVVRELVNYGSTEEDK